MLPERKDLRTFVTDEVDQSMLQYVCMYVKYLHFILVCHGGVSVINRYHSSCFKSLVIGLVDV